MLEKLKYKNHVNEVFDFGKNGVYVNMTDLHDYEWSVTKRGNKISALEHAISKRKLPVIIICKTETEGIAARNKLLEITEKDVLAMQHGRVIVGDYYFKCFVTKSQKSNYLINKRYMTLTLTLTSDYPYWVKESMTAYRKETDGVGGLDYVFDYPYDYVSDLTGTDLNNSGFMPSNFRMIIYGACINPAVNINGHTYQVNCQVGADEYLTIDSTTKKIYLTTNDGTVINKFNDRNKASYIFEKVPSGKNTVSWQGNFGVEIILLEERSEPKWI